MTGGPRQLRPPAGRARPVEAPLLLFPDSVSGLPGSATRVADSVIEETLASGPRPPQQSRRGRRGQQTGSCPPRRGHLPAGKARPAPAWGGSCTRSRCCGPCPPLSAVSSRWSGRFVFSSSPSLTLKTGSAPSPGSWCSTTGAAACPPSPSLAHPRRVAAPGRPGRPVEPFRGLEGPGRGTRTPSRWTWGLPGQTGRPCNLPGKGPSQAPGRNAGPPVRQGQGNALAWCSLAAGRAPPERSPRLGICHPTPLFYPGAGGRFP